MTRPDTSYSNQKKRKEKKEAACVVKQNRALCFDTQILFFAAFHRNNVPLLIPLAADALFLLYIIPPSISPICIVYRPCLLPTYRA